MEGKKRRGTDNGKYPTWKILCCALAGLLVLAYGLFITSFITKTDKAEANIQKLYEVKVDKTDMQEIKGDIKEIQKDIKILLKR